MAGGYRNSSGPSQGRLRSNRRSPTLRSLTRPVNKVIRSEGVSQNHIIIGKFLKYLF